MRLEASVLLNAEYCLRCCLDLSTLVNTAFSLQLFLISSLSAFPLSHLLGQMLQKWTNTENILPSGNTVRAIVIFHALKFLYLSHTSSSLWKRATQNQKYYIVTFGNMSFDLFFLFFFFQNRYFPSNRCYSLLEDKYKKPFFIHFPIFKC